jgi:hypothetical protein
MEKKCFKCGIVKPLDDFYLHKQMKDGHLNKCKDCNKADTKRRTDELSDSFEFMESERKRGRDKYHRLYSDLGYKPPKVQNAHRKKFPEKYAAANAAQNIKSDGNERHHWSYNEVHRTDIIFLNKKAHMKAHRFIVYDQERFMYRRYDTNELLDTKEKHREFIKWCIENKED